MTSSASSGTSAAGRSLAGKATTAARLLRTEGFDAVRERVSEQIRPFLVIDESHVWYRLNLTALPAPKPLPEGTRLHELTDADVPQLEKLPTIGPDEAHARLADGARAWLVLEGSEPLFACWVFRDSAPVLAADGGRLSLPPNIVLLEDSVTAAAARGRGVAPAAWSQVAPLAAEGGATTLITKVAVDNVASRKAVVKAGFVASAVVDFRRVGGRGGRTALHPTEISEVSTWLAKALPATAPFIDSRGTTIL
jgi:acetyltransferase (GNAT) family protein